MRVKSLSVGVDPCEETAQPDYFLKFGAFVNSLENGSVRRVTKINDLAGAQPVSINDTLAFPLQTADGDIISMVVVGRNVIDSLEQFAENFEIESAIAIGDQALTVHDYYEEERPTELNTLIRAGNLMLERRVLSPTASSLQSKIHGCPPYHLVKKSGPVTLEF